ncbi:Uncharacterised protein [Sphingobacterium thalpophilum]|uniref:Uncharacterized protein n=1 Tax=Sphingobacterium thalpophilum TaxID=259 RepID=A0A4V6KRD5_9SPHI|nr:Uncharacterised protein [Sphingobacterium thalpophilum]
MNPTGFVCLIYTINLSILSGILKSGFMLSLSEKSIPGGYSKPHFMQMGQEE